MPNWCSDTLVVIGPYDPMMKLREEAKGVDTGGKEAEFLFQSLCPMPSDKEELKRQAMATPYYKWASSMIGHRDDEWWYPWRCGNWGTKWDLAADSTTSEFYDEPKEVCVWTLMFDTAWGPPVELLHKVAAKHPELRFELSYYEPGMNFAGRMRWEGGELVHEREGTCGDFEFSRHCYDGLEDESLEEEVN